MNNRKPFFDRNKKPTSPQQPRRATRSSDPLPDAGVYTPSIDIGSISVPDTSSPTPDFSGGGGSFDGGGASGSW